MTPTRLALVLAAIVSGLAAPAFAFSGNSGGGGILLVVLIIVAGPAPWGLIAGGLLGARTTTQRPTLGAIVGVAGVGIAIMGAMLLVVGVHDRPDGQSVREAIWRGLTHGLVPFMLPTLGGAAVLLALPLGTALAAVARAWPHLVIPLVITSALGVVVSVLSIARHAFPVMILLSAAGGATCIAVMLAALVVRVRTRVADETTADQ